MLIVKYRYHILLLLFALTLLWFWPGIPMHDSNWQYQQALSAQYSDHHPPLMSFIWRAFDKLHAGFGSMFLLQLAMLYGAVAVLLKTTDYLGLRSRTLATALLLIYPVYPQILIYAVIVLKDVQFATSFLFASAILAFYTVQKRYPSWWAIGSILCLLVYGTAVKYQAMYLVLMPALWLGVILGQHQPRWRQLFTGMLVYVCIISVVWVINHNLIPNVAKSYAWQYVKLYDLAALSIAEHTDLIPMANKTANYNFTALQQRFKYPAIDALTFSAQPLLTITQDSQAMQQLCKEWRQAILRYPLSFLQHRMRNLSYMLMARPGFAHEVQDVALRFVNEFPSNTITHTLVQNIAGLLFFIFMSHLPVILLGIVYLLLALRVWRKSQAAHVLFNLCATALLMVLLLFFMSMAGTPRYTYISILLIHAGHVFAIAACQSINKHPKHYS